MTKKDKFRIKVQGKMIEVSKEIYLTYYQMYRHARYLCEKDTKNGTFLFSDLEIGEEMIPDTQSLAVEDSAINKILIDQLRQCIRSLSQSDRELIYALYAEGLNEQQISDRSGVPRMTIHDRKVRLLRKLQKELEKGT